MLPPREVTLDRILGDPITLLAGKLPAGHHIWLE